MFVGEAGALGSGLVEMRELTTGTPGGGGAGVPGTVRLVSLDKK